MTRTVPLLLAALALGAPPATAAAAAPRPAPEAEPGPLKFPSLLSAESLHGNSGAVGYAGFSSIGAAYAQGITLQDDLGATVDFDWGTTELRLGALWRRPLGTAGGWTMGGRIGVSWYVDFGGKWIQDDNRSDRGVTLAPALVLSTRAGEGVVSITGDLPLTLTTWRGGGFQAAPKASVGFEAPLYGPWTLGITGGLQWRGGSGGAPMRSGRLQPELLVMAGYRVF
jgi:hypothetical protein